VSGRGRLQRVGIVGHLGRASVRQAAERLRRALTKSRTQVRLDAELARSVGQPGTPLPVLARWCQLLVTLGGDGTALAGGRALAGHRGALLPINFGGLGFLTVAEAAEADAAVRQAIAGRWPVRRRSMVRVRLMRRERAVYGGRALNDVVIKATGGGTAVHLQVETLGSDLGRLVADGLIAATATGSTAYSLSAGGPVLAPEAAALLVTPVCAHSLGTRSLVLAPKDDLAVRVIGSSDRMSLLLDGHEHFELLAGDTLVFRLVPDALRIVDNPERPFARALRDKLGWQGSARRSF